MYICCVFGCTSQKNIVCYDEIVYNTHISWFFFTGNKSRIAKVVDLVRKLKKKFKVVLCLKCTLEVLCQSNNVCFISLFKTCYNWSFFYQF